MERCKHDMIATMCADCAKPVQTSRPAPKGKKNPSSEAWVKRQQRLTRKFADYDGTEWTAEEDAFVRDSTMPVTAVALRLGRTYEAVNNRRFRLIGGGS